MAENTNPDEDMGIEERQNWANAHPQFADVKWREENFVDQSGLGYFLCVVEMRGASAPSTRYRGAGRTYREALARLRERASR